MARCPDVRLIRSKGVGVFFVTQLPDDVPGDVLAQLGNRVQHALRAFTPRDAKALKAAVTTYPKTDDYDLEQDLTQLGTGEAMITILSERGAPTPVVWTRMLPPTSLMAAIPPAEVDATAKADAIWAAYSTEIDPESAPREAHREDVGIHRRRGPNGRGRGERTRAEAQRCGGPQAEGQARRQGESAEAIAGGRRRQPGDRLPEVARGTRHREQRRARRVRCAQGFHEVAVAGAGVPCGRQLHPRGARVSRAERATAHASPTPRT